MSEKRVKVCEIKRHLPEWAKVVKTVNTIDIYNMNVFENIMSWNQDNLDGAAFDYYGNVITYRELPDLVKQYYWGLRSLGVTENSIVTLCLPVSIENMATLFALNCLGAIANNVNYLFLKSDFDLYTTQKNSDTLIIFEGFLPEVVDYIEDSKIKNVIITNLTDYLPEENKHIFDDLSYLPKRLLEIFDNPQKRAECIAKVSKIQGVHFIPMSLMLQLGSMSPLPMPRGPVDIERDTSYSYTSGTTGKPKCIVYKEDSANALIELHIGIDSQDHVGERVFQVIPLTHATGERFSGYLQMAHGKTMVPQPIYNKDTFGIDLMTSRCNWITAAPSFYLAGVAQGFIGKDAFAHIARPCAGGEVVTKTNVKLIDEWLKMNGCNVRLAIGGGASEDGSSTLTSYFMDEQTKTNETGHPVMPGIRARVVDDNGNELPIEQRGTLQVSSPAAADRYLNNPEASAKRWFYDADGIRWGNTGDIAVKHADGSYNILGRASDSVVDENGNTKFLFDIENSLDIDDPIIEWEITAHTTDVGAFIVGQIILKPDNKLSLPETIEMLCEKYTLDAIKIYKKFENSDVTGKRDLIRLQADKDGYYAPCDNDHMYKMSFAGGKLTKSTVLKSEVR